MYNGVAGNAGLTLFLEILMKKLLSLFAVVGMLSAAGCKKDDKKDDSKAAKEAPKEVKNGEADKKPTEPTEPTSDETKGEVPGMANKMEHCPASVAGSKTVVADGEGVVVVTTTASDEAAIADIRKRSVYLVGLNDVDMSDTKHSGSGTGGGGQGMCPVAVGLATLASEDIEGGAKITMTPRKEGTFAELSAAVKTRATNMATGGKAGGHGHGMGMGGGKHHGGTGGGAGGDGAGKGDHPAKGAEHPAKDDKATP